MAHFEGTGYHSIERIVGEHIEVSVRKQREMNDAALSLLPFYSAEDFLSRAEPPTFMMFS